MDRGEYGRETIKDKTSAALWSGFLQERSGDYVGAAENYDQCTKLADDARPRDIVDQRNCASGLNRVKCAVDFNPSTCHASPGIQALAVTITTRREGGAHTASALDADDVSETEAPPPMDSQSVVIDLPTQREIDDIHNSMTDKQKAYLLQMLKIKELNIKPRQ